MRLDAVSVPNVPQGQPLNQTAPADPRPALTEGDVVSARVIAAEDRAVTLKTPEGAIFRARLEGGVLLRPGADVQLLVTERSGDLIIMSLARPGQMAAAPAEPGDPMAQALLRQLTALGYPPTEETLAAARTILAALPDASPGEAAFLAGNGLPPEPAMLDALRALFAGTEDTGSMLDTLLTLTPREADMGRPAEVPTHTPGGTADTAHARQPDEAPAAEALGDTPRETAVRPGPLPQGAETPAAPGPDAAAPAAPPEMQPGPQETRPPAFAQWLSKALGTDAAIPARGESPLSHVPLFQGLSARSRAGISESLARIAASIPDLGDEAELFEHIEKFARSLFLRPEDGARATAAKLRAGREELFLRLAFFRDAVSASASGAKAAILEQTQKLMDHTRLLSGLDQFAYLQLPIQMEGRRKSAQLYIYKKDRGGTKRIDPEDVRILLALDLEHMGHLETLIDIRGREVSLRFDVENNEIAASFKQNATKLHKLLDALGYKFTNSSVLIKKV